MAGGGSGGISSNSFIRSLRVDNAVVVPMMLMASKSMVNKPDRQNRWVPALPGTKSLGICYY